MSAIQVGVRLPESTLSEVACVLGLQNATSVDVVRAAVYFVLGQPNPGRPINGRGVRTTNVFNPSTSSVQ